MSIDSCGALSPRRLNGCAMVKLVAIVMLMLSAQWVAAQVAARPLAPQPYQGQQTAGQAGPPTVTGGGMGPAAGPAQPGAYRGQVPIRPAQPGVAGAVGGLAGQNALGGPLAPYAAQPATPGAPGLGGPPLASGNGDYGLGLGAASLAPAPVRTYLGQPGVAGTGLGPVQTTGAGLPVITTPTGVQLASTGYGASAQTFGFGPYLGPIASISPGPQPYVVSPSWMLAPTAPGQGAYGSLGPPFNVVSAASAAPALGMGRPAPIGIGSYAPLPTAAAAPATGGFGTAGQAYTRPQRSYWFRLGKGGLGKPTTPPP
jgi:hypothetical protein